MFTFLFSRVTAFNNGVAIELTFIAPCGYLSVNYKNLRYALRVRFSFNHILTSWKAEKEGTVSRCWSSYTRMHGISMRHRYGDDIDILRATFTKTIEQVNEETFQLMQKTKVLHHAVMKMNETIPKITKYRYGTLLENGVHSLLADCCRIQRKYYRRNMLESMHIEVDILQHYFFECHIDYTEWMTTQQLYVTNNLANEVSSIIGGLLKTTVA